MMDSFELHFLRLQQAGPDQQPHQRCLPYRPQCNYWPAAAHGSQQLPLGCLPRRCSAVDGDDVRVTSMLCRLATDSVDNPGLTAACLSRRMCCHVARRALDLSMNTFSGILPGGISALAALQSLAVASNYLVGTLPPEVTTLSSLVYAAIASLRRGKNSASHHKKILLGVLGAPLPLFARCAVWRRDRELDVSYNSLMGSLPDGISTLGHLTYVGRAGARWHRAELGDRRS